jgi:hypothetical protein
VRNFCWAASANTGWEKWHLLKKQKWHKNIKSGKKSGVKNKFYANIAE